MIQEKKLSIIIPTYKDKCGLDLLLKSVITLQSNIQVIVVDDDTKKSAAWVKKKYNFVEYYQNENNRGAGGARNTGISYASCDYVMFADSDDYFITNALGSVIESMKRKNGIWKDSPDLIYLRPTAVFENSNKRSKRADNYISLLRRFIEDGDESLLFLWYVPWSKIISLKLIVEYNIKFDEVMYSNDVNFSLLCGLTCTSVTYLDNNIYVVTESSSSLTKSKTLESTLCRISVVKKYNSILTFYGLKKYRIFPFSQITDLAKSDFGLCLKVVGSSIFDRSLPLFDYRLFKKPVRIKDKIGVVS